jgi:phenylacetate-CoA ligase
LKNRTPANNNEPGEIIVTNLNNYVFPFIRYRIGDEAIVSNQSCKCGINLPLVKAINGRITDTIITPNNKQLPGLFVADIFDRLSKFVRQYQIIQVEDNELLVKIIPTDKMTKKKIKEIEKHIYDCTERSMAVKIDLVKEISFEKSGKRRLVISNREYPRSEKIGEMY